ncbi:hypothetical protein ACFE04_025881 [Oxalis oulophora]
MDKYLNQLNKLSHKISKPTTTTTTTTTTNNNNNTAIVENHNFDQSQTIQPHHQPPVYTINKNDFREVVQMLTGLMPREPPPPPPPIQLPKPPSPPSSRLQRFRPPPLALKSNPPMTNSAALSPLPPFPTVSVAAESPVSAYLRNFDPILRPPLPPLQQFQHQQFKVPPPPDLGASSSSSSQPPPQFQLSPLPFGCLNSPRSAYPFLSPKSLFSQFGLPLSPTMLVPSPK